MGEGERIYRILYVCNLFFPLTCHWLLAIETGALDTAVQCAEWKRTNEWKSMLE